MDYSKYILRTAGCPALGDWAIKNKLTVKWGSAKRGDLVLFDFNGNETSDHVGFVTKVTSTYIETIEGNTGSGSNTNGDGVYRRRRTKGQVNYFVRTKCPDIESVIRRAEAELGYKEGRNNSNKYGKWFGMNNVSWCCIFVVYCFAHALGETKPLPKPTGKYTGVIPVPTLKYGSDGIAVKNLQSFLNWYGCKLTVDGEFGSATQEAVKLFQKSEGISSDGIYGKNSYAKASAYKDSTTVKKQCIDTSYWQGKHSVADWQKVGKTCSHAIHRASFTEQAKFELNPDSTFATNVVNAFKAGLKCGAYHYSQAITVAEAKKEANYLCDILDKYRPYINYYVVCDYEFGKRLNSKIGTKASEIANAFCDVVKARGYSPCIYANYTMLTKYLKAPKHPVWVAQYNSTCSYKGEKVLWQYTSSGSVEGISGKVDLSYVYKKEVPAPAPIKTGYSGSFPDFVQHSRNYLDKTARELAYAKGTTKATYNYKTGKPKGTFTTAIKKVYGSVYSKWSKQCRMGASCDVFVGTVLRYSGCDTTWPRGLESQIKKTPKHMSEVTDIKAGDMMYYLFNGGGHTRMIVDISGKLYNCEANYKNNGGQYGHIGTLATAKPKNATKMLKIFRVTSAFRTYLEKDDVGSEVTKWQKFLKWYGYDCVADGDFGEKTEGFTKTFQLNNGLTADGQAGAKTIAKAKEIKK